jgi:hypothetical protein
MLRHRTEVIILYRKRDFGVTEHLNSQGSVAEMLLWTEYLRSSIGALPRGYRACVQKCTEKRTPLGVLKDQNFVEDFEGPV